MKAESIISEIKSLPTQYPSKKTEQKANISIMETAVAIAPILEQKGLRIVNGGTSQSTKNRFTRIYLETLENTSHDYRTQNYKDTVICVWEWQTKKSGYFNPLTCKAIVNFCDELRQTVEDYGMANLEV